MRGRVEWIRGYGHEFRLAYKMEFIMQELCQEKGALVFKAAKPRGTRLSADHTGSVRWLGGCLTLYLLVRDAPSSNVRAQKRRSTAPRITSHLPDFSFRTSGLRATTR